MRLPLAALLVGALATPAVADPAPKPKEAPLCGSWGQIQINLAISMRMSLDVMLAYPDGRMFALMSNNQQQWALFEITPDVEGACLIMEGTGVFLPKRGAA